MPMVTTMFVVLKPKRIDQKGQEVIFLGERNILDLNLGSVYMGVYNYKTHQTTHLITVYSIVWTQKYKIKIHILTLYR